MNQSLITDIQRVMPLTRSTGLFTSLCSFQQPDGVIGPSGAEGGNYVAVAGLQNIPCKKAPPSNARIQATEVKALQDITGSKLQHVLLSGYYGGTPVTLATTGATVFGPQNNWHAIIDGETWEVLGVENDSHNQQTRLEVRIVSK